MDSMVNSKNTLFVIKSMAYQNIKQKLLNENNIRNAIAGAVKVGKNKAKIFEQQELPHSNGYLCKDIIEQGVNGISLLEQLQNNYDAPYVIYGKTKRTYYQVYIKWPRDKTCSIL